jgi:hypothetical protein
MLMQEVEKNYSFSVAGKLAGKDDRRTACGPSSQGFNE